MTVSGEVAHAGTRYRQAYELLTQILPLQQPADQIIERYFKAHKQMGSKDRAFAAETVYGVLRHKREVKRLIGDTPMAMALEVEAHWLLATYLISKAGWSARALQQTAFSGDAEVLVKHIRQTDKSQWSEVDRCNWRDDHFDRLAQQFDATERQALSQALNQPASVDMRVNTLKRTREDVMLALQAEGFECTHTPFSPFGLRRLQRGPLFNTTVFKNGDIEIQDEGSQLIGLLVQAKPKETIVDFCAGAGGKTLLLATQMHNRGTLWACDISLRRLEQMRPRLARAGVDNVRLLPIQNETDAALLPLKGKADKVLVDAPCSGSGTWRRNPDMKWRSMDIDDLAQQQFSILSAAAALVKPAGCLVYATCSLFDAENAAVVKRFLAAHDDFRLEPAENILLAQGVSQAKSLVNADGMMQLFPHRHATDGFFAAVLVRDGVLP